ncbi:MAG TPA: nucleotide exchange factor GrpE [Allosphingosinicella sp.]|nr:nucleotide exchange factor GrpE [Allosphingosinicella sp.]
MNEEDEKIELEGEIDFGGGLNVDRLGEIEKELEDVRQHVLYAQAETQNVRRRLEQEKVAASQYAATAFARDMLSVKDNLERALSAIPEEMREDERTKGLIAGLEATGRELDSAFQRHGVARVESLGKPLDPHFHQAMLEVPSDEEPGTIVQEMQAGYTIKERLLRPALVGVAKKG